MTRAALVNLGDGIAARVVERDGENVFWIHGYTLDATCWQHVWEGLPHWSHAAVDLPGHGNSLPLQSGTALSDLARTIGALAVARGARHLVAMSFGAAVALQIVLEFPDAFSTLTLGAPILGGGPFDPDVWQRYDDVKASFAHGGYGPHLAQRWAAGDAALFRGVARRPQLLEQLRRQVSTHPWWDLADDAYANLWHQPQFLKDLPAVSIPVLVLSGASDSDATRQSAGFLARLLPRCTTRELPDTGHLCLLEDPPAVAAMLEHQWGAHAPAHAL